MNLEEIVMFTNEDEGFQELFDRLVVYSSTKQSVKMSKSKRQTRRDDPMDVDALSKRKSKGKSKKGVCWLRKGQQRSEPDEQRQVLELREVWPLRQ